MHDLEDLQLNGGQYTWSSHQSQPAIPRLDRFLVFKGWIDLNPLVCQSILPKPASDHFPVLLDSGRERWGSSPFQFESMWLKERQFHEVIRMWWKDL